MPIIFVSISPRIRRLAPQVMSTIEAWASELACSLVRPEDLETSQDLLRTIRWCYGRIIDVTIETPTSLFCIGASSALALPAAGSTATLGPPTILIGLDPDDVSPILAPAPFVSFEDPDEFNTNMSDFFGKIVDQIVADSLVFADIRAQGPRTRYSVNEARGIIAGYSNEYILDRLVESGHLTKRRSREGYLYDLVTQDIGF